MSVAHEFLVHLDTRRPEKSTLKTDDRYFSFLNSVRSTDKAATSLIIIDVIYNKGFTDRVRAAIGTAVAM